MIYRCPTDPIPYADPQPHDPPGGLGGCGQQFEGEPDHEGLVDCPECGMWFLPREQDVVVAA